MKVALGVSIWDDKLEFVFYYIMILSTRWQAEISTPRIDSWLIKMAAEETRVATLSDSMRKYLKIQRVFCIFFDTVEERER